MRSKCGVFLVCMFSVRISTGANTACQDWVGAARPLRTYLTALQSIISPQASKQPFCFILDLKPRALPDEIHKADTVCTITLYTVTTRWTEQLRITSQVFVLGANFVSLGGEVVCTNMIID